MLISLICTYSLSATTGVVFATALLSGTQHCTSWGSGLIFKGVRAVVMSLGFGRHPQGDSPSATGTQRASGPGSPKPRSEAMEGPLMVTRLARSFG